MPINTVINGRLGADAEVAYSNDGKPRLQLRLAADSGYGDKKKTDWVSVTLFGTRAEKLAAHLTKGKEVIVTGVLTGREYEGAKGKGFSLDVVANDVTFIGSKGDKANSDNAPATVSNSSDAAPF